MMLTTGLGSYCLEFVLESKQEVRKVVWPTRDETMRTTLLVFAMVFIVGLILWLLDMFLFWGVRFNWAGVRECATLVCCNTPTPLLKIKLARHWKIESKGRSWKYFGKILVPTEEIV